MSMLLSLLLLFLFAFVHALSLQSSHARATATVDAKGQMRRGQVKDPHLHKDVGVSKPPQKSRVDMNVKGSVAAPGAVDKMLQPLAGAAEAVHEWITGTTQSAKPEEHCSVGLLHMLKDLHNSGQLIPKDGDAPTGHQLESGSNDAEVDYLAKLANDELSRLNRAPGDGTVCQTGFNFGNSAYAFLCGTTAKVFSWDLGQHSYVKPVEALIEKQFPGRHKLTLGDSTETLPLAAKGTSALGDTKCDVVFVDGGHSTEIAQADIRNFKKIAAPGALLIVDDCEVDSVRNAANRKRGYVPLYRLNVDDAFQSELVAGLIHEDTDKEKGLQQLTKDRTLCVGRYK